MRDPSMECRAPGPATTIDCVKTTTNLDVERRVRADQPAPAADGVADVAETLRVARGEAARWGTLLDRLAR